MSPDLTWFVGAPTVGRSAGHMWNIPLELSIENYKKWLEWWAQQLDIPLWWEEFITIPDVDDVQRLAQKI